MTTNNAPVGSRQRQLGIILDDNLLSAPNILQPIRKEGRITGRFTRAEVDQLAFEVERYTRELRGDQPDLSDTVALRNRNQRLMRLTRTTSMIQQWRMENGARPKP